MKHYVLQLYDYNIWANNKFFESLKELPYGVCTQEIQSVFPSITETLVHMYIIDTIWLNVMQESSMDETQASITKAQEMIKDKGLEEMEALYTELVTLYKDFFNSQENMDKLMAIEHPTAGRLDTRLSELVQHVINHGTYHRGNLTAMIHQLGYASISTDYIMYLYERQAKN